MFPSYSPMNVTGPNKDELQSTLSTQICPIGCICCIMQQFYNRKCWCKEVKESIGIQTDPLPDLPDLTCTPKQATTGAQTDDLQDSPMFPLPSNDGCGLEEPTIKTRRHVSTSSMTSSQRHQMCDVTANHRASRALSLEQSDTRSRTLSSVCLSSPHSQIVSQDDRWTTEAATSGHINLRPSDDECNTDVSHVDFDNSNEDEYFETFDGNDSADCPTGENQTLFQSQEDFFRQGTYANTILQREITRVTEKYGLTGAKDPRFEMAIQGVFQNLKSLQLNHATRRLIRSKIRQKISSRRHYDRMKDAAEKIGVHVSVLKRKRTVENAVNSDIIGNVLLANSITGVSPHSLWMNTSAVDPEDSEQHGQSASDSDVSNDVTSNNPANYDDVVIKKEIPGD